MYKTVLMPEFEQLIKKETLNVIDVRENDEYVAGHIPGAVNMPLSNLATSFETLDKSRPYYLVCQSGGRSQMAAQFLVQNGYEVTNVMGGFGSWRGEVE